MRLKKFLTAALMSAALFFSSTVDAQVVTVQGAGVNDAAAAKDARRAAVEQVVGTMIKARSIAMDMEVVLDAVDSRTQGYVNSFEVIERRESGGLVTIKARVDVSSEPNSSLMKDVEMVMSLHDPRIGVVIEHYGDDGGETFRKYTTMLKAQIREELIKRGFSHVVDTTGDVDYVIVGNLTVGAAKAIKLPSWNSIGDAEFKTADTGFSKSTAALDCRIKKFSTDELIGEFHSQGASNPTAGDDAGAQAVLNLASDAAQQVRNLFNREASKVFSSVKITATLNDGDKILQLEEALRQVEQVNSVYVRGFNGGSCTIDVGTDLSPQQLYQMLKATSGGLTISLKGFSGNTLEIGVA